jgi:hypothetical protein
MVSFLASLLSLWTRSPLLSHLVENPPVVVESIQSIHSSQSSSHNHTHYQAQSNRHNSQGDYYHAKDTGYIFSENAMQHILRELLLEHKLSGPIHGALENGGYYEPHQVILLDPIGLHTNRSASGEYMDDSVPFSQ